MRLISIKLRQKSRDTASLKLLYLHCQQILWCLSLLEIIGQFTHPKEASPGIIWNIWCCLLVQVVLYFNKVYLSQWANCMTTHMLWVLGAMQTPANRLSKTLPANKKEVPVYLRTHTTQQRSFVATHVPRARAPSRECYHVTESCCASVCSLQRFWINWELGRFYQN